MTIYDLRLCFPYKLDYFTHRSLILKVFWAYCLKYFRIKKSFNSTQSSQFLFFLITLQKADTYNLVYFTHCYKDNIIYLFKVNYLLSVHIKHDMNLASSTQYCGSHKLTSGNAQTKAFFPFENLSYNKLSAISPLVRIYGIIKFEPQHIFFFILFQWKTASTLSLSRGNPLLNASIHRAQPVNKYTHILISWISNNIHRLVCILLERAQKTLSK